MKKIAVLFLKLLGWKLVNKIDPMPKKYVLIGGPHTSNWDALYGLSAAKGFGLRFKIMAKSSFFVFPLGYLLKAMGGLPVDRSKKNSLVDQTSDYFKKTDSLAVILAPEGTRKKVTNLKKGFYYIAQKAGVPIIVGYMDYKNKVVCLDHIIEAKETDPEKIEACIKNIQVFYSKIEGRHPENGISL